MIVAAQSFGYPPFDVSTLAVSAPTPICDLDLNALKGELRRLSWSPDARSIHLKTIEDGAIAHDYILSLDDRELAVAFGEPEWASPYWARKSSQSAPGVPGLTMEVTESHRRTRPMPFTGGTFGWGPAGSAALVFVDRPGHLILLDREKHKQVVAGTSGA